MAASNFYGAVMRKPGTILYSLLITLFIGGCTITPEPLTRTELDQQRTEDLNNLFSNQEPISEPIDLYEAMARALMYNLDSRLKLMEEALARGQLEVLKYDLLPELTAEAGYNTRSNQPGASSESLKTGEQSLEASKSIEKTYYDANLTMTWNILDFGVSYARAEQQADRVLIMRERRRKVIQNIIQDVRNAYWRAVSAEELLPRMDDMLAQAEDALEYSRQLESLRLQSPLTPLKYQKSLLDLIRKIWALRGDLSTAKIELSTLINIRPGTVFQLADSGTDLISSANRMETPSEELEQLALLQRPELIEENYKKRISALEVRKAMLSMFPSLDLTVGQNYQDNKFLYNDSWASAGLGVSWNIMNLFSGPARIRYAETQGELDDMRRMALSMAVLSQVNLAYLRYHMALKNNLILNRADDVESRIMKHVIAGQRADREHALDVLRVKTGALLARMRQHVAHTEVENARGRLYNSIGYDPVPGNVPDHSIETLAKTIQERLESLPTSM
jgi:multidrug efflux system outer membrane protein